MYFFFNPRKKSSSLALLSSNFQDLETILEVSGGPTSGNVSLFWRENEGRHVTSEMTSQRTVLCLLT